MQQNRSRARRTSKYTERHPFRRRAPCADRQRGSASRLLRDVEAGPDLSEIRSFLLTTSVGAGQERHKNVVGSGAELDADAVLCQQSLAGNQNERA